METENNLKKVDKLTIVKIKEVSFFIKEKMFQANKDVNANLNQKMGFNLEKELINFTIQVEHRYADSNEPFAFIEVHNFFKLVNLGKYINKENPNDTTIAPDIILTMLGLSISHARALLSKNMLGTPFNNILIPIINPIDAGQHLFPKIFVKKSSVPKKLK